MSLLEVSRPLKFQNEVIFPEKKNSRTKMFHEVSEKILKSIRLFP